MTMIRELRDSDIGDVLWDILAELSPCTPLEKAEAFTAFKRRQRSGVQTFVAVEGCRLVGTASLVIEQKFTHRAGKVAHIEDVAVAAHRQGHGIGTKLVKHLIGEARRVGCYKVILDCDENLIGFYGLAGFRQRDVSMRLDLGR